MPSDGPQFSTDTSCGSFPLLHRSLSKFTVTTHWPIDLFLPQKGLATCSFPVCLFPSIWCLIDRRLPRGDRMTGHLCTNFRGAGPKCDAELWHPMGKEKEQRDSGDGQRPRLGRLKWTRTPGLLPWYLFHGWPAQFSSQLITCYQIKSFSTRFLIPLFQQY